MVRTDLLAGEYLIKFMPYDKRNLSGRSADFADVPSESFVFLSSEKCGFYEGKIVFNPTLGFH